MLAEMARGRLEYDWDVANGTDENIDDEKVEKNIQNHHISD